MSEKPGDGSGSLARPLPLPTGDGGRNGSAKVGVEGESPVDVLIADGLRLDLGGTTGGGTAIGQDGVAVTRYAQGDRRELG